MDSATAEHIRERLRDTPKYNDKWDVLKPVIADLCVEKRMKLKDVCELLKEQLGFSA